MVEDQKNQLHEPPLIFKQQQKTRYATRAEKYETAEAGRRGGGVGWGDGEMKGRRITQNTPFSFQVSGKTKETKETHTRDPNKFEVD